MVLTPGDRVGRFVVRELWASQGSTEVWKAHDPESDRAVVLRAKRVRNRSGEALKARLDAFIEDARSLNHTQLVAVLDAGVDGEVFFVVSEDMQGTLLSELLQRARVSDKWPNPATAAKIVEQVAEAVAYVHSAPSGDGKRRGHLDFDLTPASIVVAPDGDAKLVEAIQASASQDLVDTAGRGPSEQVAYISPEVVKHGRRSERADVFALGAILWELIVHRPPFEGRDELERLQRAETGQTAPLPLDLALPWPEILKASLNPDPELRPASAADFAKELAKHSAGRDPVADWFAELPARPKTARLEAADQQPVDQTIRSDPPEDLLRQSRPSGAHDSGAADPFFDGNRDGLASDRFEILGRLGSGGMGEVYKVKDRELGEVVALKKIPRHAAEEMRSLDRLKREVRLARRLVSDHVCRLYDLVDLGNGDRGLTMEFIDGTTLAELMKQGLPVDYARLASWGADIASGLAAARDTGVVHRDLKPENVMIRAATDSAVLLDFGIAHEEPDVDTDDIRLTQAGIIMGTPLYMSPEQLANRNLDARSDLYSLGLILCELITGDVPLGGKNFAEILDQRVVQNSKFNVRDVDPGVPSGFAETIDRLVMSGASDRPSDPSEVKDRLRAFAEGRPVPPWIAPPVTQSVRVSHNSLVVRTWLPPLILLIVAVVVLGYFVTRPRSDDLASMPDAAVPAILSPSDAGAPDMSAPDAPDASAPDAKAPDVKRRKPSTGLPPAEEM